MRKVPDAVLDEWPSPSLAYAIGLIASDGNLEKDNNCVILNTTDKELVEVFQKVLGIPKLHVTTVYPPAPRQTVYMVQVCDNVFRKFIEARGVTPNKALTIGRLDVPEAVFADFLRGELDGDGSWLIGTGWRGAKYLVVKFTSKSNPYLQWIQKKVKQLTNLTGRFSGSAIVFNGRNAEKLGRWIYYEPNLPCLTRKRQIWSQWCE